MASSLFDLTGKSALLTGATHGLGISMAIGLAESGAQIIVNDISKDKLEAAIQECSFISHSFQPILRKLG